MFGLWCDLEVGGLEGEGVIKVDLIFFLGRDNRWFIIMVLYVLRVNKMLLWDFLKENFVYEFVFLFLFVFCIILYCVGKWLSS